MGTIKWLSLIVGIVGSFTFSSSHSHAESGAIALSKSFGIVIIGSASGSGSRRDAERWAVYDCEKKGGSDCRIVGWETGKCLSDRNGRQVHFCRIHL
jgi:hypothetical protein